MQVLFNSISQTANSQLIPQNTADNLFCMIYLSTIQNFLIIINKQKKYMEIFLNSETRLNHQRGGAQYTYLPSKCGQDQLIEMYLSHDVFYQQELQRISEISEENIEKHDSKTQNMQLQTQETIPFTKNVKKQHKKSIFHNFQKHLISTIKKYMSFSENKFNDLPQCNVAFELWSCFMKTSSFNKRLLQIVFGIETGHPNKSGLDKLSGEYNEFQKIHKRFGDDLILRAQKMIRSYVVGQSHHISKAFLRCNSNITKFEEFYGYYSQFIAEIDCGPMPKRMRKSSKQALINNLKSKRNTK